LSNQISDYCNKLSSLIESIRAHKPAAVVLMGDFNARSPLFWDGETTETAAGKKLSDF
jgi:endonuclease/exonuclease/phosphatase family metal-dependent hydrolase